MSFWRCSLVLVLVVQYLVAIPIVKLSQMIIHQLPFFPWWMWPQHQAFLGFCSFILYFPFLSFLSDLWRAPSVFYACVLKINRWNVNRWRQLDLLCRLAWCTRTSTLCSASPSDLEYGGRCGLPLTGRDLCLCWPYWRLSWSVESGCYHG